MSLFGFLKSRSSAPVARERLQILLAHERVALRPRDLVTILRDELLATIARHIELDPDKLSVRIDRADAMSTLEIEVKFRPTRLRRAHPASALGRRRPRPSFRSSSAAGFDSSSSPTVTTPSAAGEKAHRKSWA